MSTNTIHVGLLVAGTFSILYSVVVFVLWRLTGTNQSDADRGILKGAFAASLMLGIMHILTAFIVK